MLKKYNLDRRVEETMKKEPVLFSLKSEKRSSLSNKPWKDLFEVLISASTISRGKN